MSAQHRDYYLQVDCGDLSVQLFVFNANLTVVASRYRRDITLIGICVNGLLNMCVTPFDLIPRFATNFPQKGDSLARAARNPFLRRVIMSNVTAFRDVRPLGSL